MDENVAGRPETDPQPSTDRDLPVEAILRANHVAQHAERDAAPGGHMGDWQGIIRAEEQAMMDLRIVAEVKQHT